ncbi:hypothetical protein DH2020_044228 [Rehmannia glutinosa]|uniref:Protein ESKIMO 1-like n=1 Tax=Rehmannia glutinosa TaxID=99300 RepID=A0ABR0UHH8_REHGL
MLVVVFSIFLFGCFMYNEDVKSIAEFPFSRPKAQESERNVNNGGKTTTVSVVLNARTVVETEVESDRSASDKNDVVVEQKREIGSVSLKSGAVEEIETPVEEEEEEEIEIPPEDCDLFTGEWVFDNITHPIYKEDECEFLTAQSVVPPGKKSLNKTGSLSVFRIEDYNATVEFYWAPFLVESNSDDPNMHSILNRIIMPGSIKKHGKNWKNVDYLIFNTYIWWMNTFNMKILRGSFDKGATEFDEVERPVAYGRVLRTWAKWVEKNVDPKRTKVFFMSMSPLHIKSLDWENPDGIKCAKETAPILNQSMPLNVGTDRRLFALAANVTKSMIKVHVHFLNITTLSEYRKDAHTSVHTIRQGKMLTPEQQADPATFADCIHWCLPGLPDTWNEFLYARIVSQS